MPVHQEWNCGSLPLLGQNKSPRVYWGRDVWCSCKEKRELKLGKILGWPIYNSIYHRCFGGKISEVTSSFSIREMSVGLSLLVPFHRSRSWVSSRLRDLPSPRVSIFISQLHNSYVLPSTPSRRWETQFPIPFSTWHGCLLMMFADYILWNTAHSLIHQILLDSLSWIRCYARRWDRICE